MAQALAKPKQRQTFPTVVGNLHTNTAKSEQMQYQMDIFRTILIWVCVVCSLLFGAYLVPAVQQSSWPALIVSLSFLGIASYSGVALRYMQKYQFMAWVRGWVGIASYVVFIFGFLQTSEFFGIMAMGGMVVITLAVFLETTQNTYRWAIGNITTYVVVIFLRSFIHIPTFDLGVLDSLVAFGTPFAILIIITLLGLVTTQHFKSNLIQSEGRRKQLEVQETQLISSKVEAETAREKAERSDQVKSAFLASMSHELRTPLNAIINFTRFVVDGDTGPINEEQTELLSEVVDSAKHLLNLINDVLDMSKIEAGSLNLFVEDDVNLTSIITSVMSTGRSLLAHKPTQLQSEIDDNLPLIRADRQRILQVLLNIMSNACKFTDNGEIRIQVTQRNDEVIISMSDTGPGIDQKDQAMVFEAFKQTKTGLRQGGGTGLGMPIAKSLVEAHGGDMWLESQLGKGATFYVSLPIKSDLLEPST